MDTLNRHYCRVFFALAVHFYTASGALLAFFALLAVSKANLSVSFLLIFLATMVDYSDGTLARLVGVRGLTPSLEGEKLDSIVDFLHNVLLPVYLLWVVQCFPRPPLLWASTIIFAGVLRYSKHDGPLIEAGLFEGLPTPWLFVAFYLIYGGFGELAKVAIIIAASWMSFTRHSYVHIARFERLKALSACLLLSWWAIYLFVTQRQSSLRSWLLLASLVFPVYYVFILPRLLKKAEKCQEPSPV